MTATNFANEQIVLRPGMIELQWGHPDPALLPVEAVREATLAALAEFGPIPLAYGASRGAGPLLAWLCERIARAEGRRVAPEEIVLTAGNSWALDQVCTLCTEPGDVALVESPTYHLAVRILREHPLALVPVPADEHGLDIAALADTIAGLRRAGKRPRLLYTVPTFHNPTGASLCAERRRALVELAATEGLTIVEDDVYRELAYDSPAPPSLWSLAPAGTVVRLGSFSKALAPGLRLGWLNGDAALVSRLADGGLLDSGGGVNPLGANIAAALCRAGGYDTQVARLRVAYRERRDALLAGLAAHLPSGCAWETPAGGFFVWVRLPEELDAAALLPRVEATGVSYLPGARCHLDGGGTNTLRLAFSYYGPADLAEGARRLGSGLRAACVR